MGQSVWVVDSRATQDDVERLERRARAFASRHAISIEDGSGRTPATDSVYTECEYRIYSDRDASLRRLWHAVARRCLGGGSTGIWGGTIGHWYKEVR